MKFNEGAYRLRPEVKALYPNQVFEHSTKDKELVVRAIDQVTIQIYDGHFVTLYISSPMPDVLRVQIRHFLGGKNPITFPMESNLPEATPAINDEGTHITYTSGKITLSIQKNPWKMEFIADGKVITSSGEESLGYMTVSGEPHVMNRLGLGIGECIYGTGERFGHFVKNGQSIQIWNDDGGTWSDYAYKNVPFYISNKGYGLLVNSTDKVEFEVGTERAEQIGISVPGETLDYYFFYGPSMKDIMNKYTMMTGRPALPPTWSYGLWLTTSFVTPYDEKITTEFIDGMLERDIPLKVFHYDCSWMRDFHWCDFEWDEREFPDPIGMLKRIKEKGVKICVWINPYISQFSSMFEEGKEKGYFLKNAKGEVYQEDVWQPGNSFVDFTNPEATKWYQDKLRLLLDMGVDTFKTDFGECIPTEAVYFDGSDPVQMHNYYTYLYNQAVFDLLEDYYGKGNALLFARSATAGCQKFPVHWGGDTVARFGSMAEELRGGLSFAMSGCAFWSHDIGGFMEKATPAMYKRWVAWGLFSSHSRLHGYDSYRVPWLFDEESVDVVRFFTKTKNKLMPYLYAASVDAHKYGWPTMRPMTMEFTEDHSCDYLDRQYMLGDSLLVAPVFNEESMADYYLPKGFWTNFFTGEVVEGGKWFNHEVGFMEMPVFVRENSVVAMNSTDDRPDYDYVDGVELHLFNIAKDADITTVVPNQDGTPAAEFKTTRSGDVITIATDGKAEDWSIVLRGITSDTAVTGGEIAGVSEAGLVINPQTGAKSVEISLG